jgi:hypothetical protein
MSVARARTDDERMRKRLRAIHVVQSQAAFRFCMTRRGAADCPAVEPPDALDATIPCRRWKWLMSNYDKGLKAHHANHAPATPSGAVADGP